MSKKSCKIYITYNKRIGKYYVGQTETPETRYAAHRNTYGREVIVNFTASDDRSKRLEEEQAMFQFCEGMGLPLENKILLRRYKLEYVDNMPEERVNDTLNLGRFSGPPILILASLAGSPKHGYAIMKDIEAFAGVRLGPGTLYGAIARLKTQGLIEPLSDEELYRSYRLTASGVAFLQKELSGLETFASVGLQRLASL